MDKHAFNGKSYVVLPAGHFEIRQCSCGYWEFFGPGYHEALYGAIAASAIKQHPEIYDAVKSYWRTIRLRAIKGIVGARTLPWHRIEKGIKDGDGSAI